MNSPMQKIILSITLLLTFTILNAQEPIRLENYSFKHSGTTQASEDFIWTLWTDVENWKQFDERIEYSHLIDTDIFAVGSRGVMKGKGAPRTAFEVIALDEGNSFTIKLELPLYQRVELQRYFEPSDINQTTFTHEVNFRGRLKSLYYLFLAGPFKSDLKLVIDEIQAIADRSVSSL